MSFFWVHDRVRKSPFLVFWKIVKDNITNYFTKNHPKKITLPSEAHKLSPKWTQARNPDTRYLVTSKGLLNPSHPVNRTKDGKVLPSIQTDKRRMGTNKRLYIRHHIRRYLKSYVNHILVPTLLYEHPPSHL